jgi:hypothetical protein
MRRYVRLALTHARSYGTLLNGIDGSLLIV